MRYIIKECFNFKNISSIREIITMYNLLNNKIECVYIDHVSALLIQFGSCFGRFDIVG
jgi:hypothetical protein